MKTTALLRLVPWVLFAPAALLAQTTSLPQWKLANFSAAQLANGTADDNADANGDGTVNLLAYASGLTPFQFAGASLPATSMVGGRLRMSFVRRTAAPDVNGTKLGAVTCCSSKRIPSFGDAVW